MTRQIDWRSTVSVHPAADLFPMLGDDELDELAKDIEANSLRAPLSIWRSWPGATWQLLDGRNRVAAMARLPDGDEMIKGAIGVANQYEPQVDPVAFVISANIRRRHLSPEQKRELISNVLRADPSRSNRSIAKLAESNRTTVGQVRADLEAAGEVSIIDTRTDARGHQQPAHKPAHRLPPAAVVHNTTPRPAPLSKEQQLRALREDRAAPASSSQRRTLVDEIVALHERLNTARAYVRQIDRATRLSVAYSWRTDAS